MQSKLRRHEKKEESIVCERTINSLWSLQEPCGPRDLTVQKVVSLKLGLPPKKVPSNAVPALPIIAKQSLPMS